ncbi:class C beta-lactamase [Pseudomonas fontis]|uniref:Beta-lactamase n=1 Tax=Pseudomonas fontis TaxID=2942633 RepID=A0ABT5NYX3_9PSED|nr:class C beta-lactamase [Pseudomonas fontis]MDD0977140.1 beta-lactamase [Pseudomonas fontis]MDD0993403.1 beta-lactamase [Pseudomonas fontis]
MHPFGLYASSALLAFSSYATAADLDSVVNAAARKLMAEQHIPGLAVGVIVDGQQHLYTFGHADQASGQAVTADTLFEIGSISKTFTATLAAYAQANGKLDLQAPVARYLPELQGRPFGDVRLLNLATHTSGGFPLQVPDAVQNHAQLMDYLKAWKPTYPTGTYRTYANPSIGMLAVIAAKALDTPFQLLMEQQVFPRLGLNNTFIRVPADKQASYAWGYDKAGAAVRVSPGVLADEAYGVKTSVRDLLHFVEVNLGAPLADKALASAVNTTHTGYFNTGAMVQDLVWEQYSYPVALQTLIDGNGNSWALQSHPVTALTPPMAPRQDVWINKTGATNGFGAYVAFVPAKRMGVVLLANSNYPNEQRVRLAHEILSAAEKP